MTRPKAEIEAAISIVKRSAIGAKMAGAGSYELLSALVDVLEWALGTDNDFGKTIQYCKEYDAKIAKAQSN